MESIKYNEMTLKEFIKTEIDEAYQDKYISVLTNDVLNTLLDNVDVAAIKAALLSKYTEDEAIGLMDDLNEHVFSLPLDEPVIENTTNSTFNVLGDYKMEYKEANSKLIHLVGTLLECGYADVEFMLSELDSFKVEFDEAYDYVREYSNKGEIKLNDIIYRIYNIALNNALYDISYNFDKEYRVDLEEITDSIRDKFNPFLNYLDSHFWLDDFVNGEQIEVYDYDELVEALTKYVENEITKEGN